MVISGIVDESPNSLLPCPARIREVSAKQLSGANLKLVSLWDSSWLQLRLPGPLLLGVDYIMSLQFDHVGRQAAGPGMYLVTEKVAGGGASKQTGAAWSPIPPRDTDPGLLSEHPRR